ncbi:MAG: TonB-dependent receptor [Bryobacteraceae bacterium]
MLSLGLSLATVLAQVRLEGRVVNENNAPLPGARLTLRPGNLVTISDPTGAFFWDVPAAGEYTIDIECAGYFPLRNGKVRPGEEVQFVLNRQREQFESIDVIAPPAVVSLDTTSTAEGVTATQIVNVPYPNTNDLRSALRILPSVRRDQRGGLHINGGSEEQVLYTLNGFNVTDPLTGRFETRLSVESVQSADVVSGRYSAEYGKGSAGALVIHTRSGDDKLRYAATNFLPGVENRKGLVIGDWTPRVNVSGPIRRGRAWFSESFDVQYSKRVVEDLPNGEDRTASWRYSNLLHTQWNITPSNILYASVLNSLWNAPRSNLGALDPVETTIDRRSRQWLFTLKDQIYLPGRALLEVGYGWNRTFGREIPQGQEYYLVLPDGRRGNHFVDAVRKAGRDQVIMNAFLPSFELAGGHQIKSGLDWDRVSYGQEVRRTGYDFYDQGGVLLRRTAFHGNGALRTSNYESAFYVTDSWRVRPRLLLEAGMRADADRVVNRWDVSPRLGVAWSPPGLENTKISGGFARVYDAANLRLFTRPQDQYSLTTYFAQNGAIGRGPALAVFTRGDAALDRPRYHNWSAGFEQRWPRSLYSRFEYLRRRGGRGFTYVNSLEPGAPPPREYLDAFKVPMVDAVYALRNQRRDIFDSLELTVRQTLRSQYEWLGSYTWSRAFSNAVVDLSQEDPILLHDNVGRMPWDAPHRFLSWGYLPTLWKQWAVAYLTELRTGYPFSVQTDAGAVLGGLNTQRFPMHFDLNVHLERRFEMRGHRWAFRFGANNITNRRNPDAVINNPASPRFMTFLGGSGRSTNFRIRWLGRS